MSTAKTKKKPVRKPVRTPTVRKRKPKTFGEWAQSVAGIVKNAPPDLSMREGFGD